ncbi:MAG: hypothetical protein HYR76_04575 [Ignavibacteria bacterium]|nr:hypothetical protein [Ignavibacteria bacterium]MBI3765597.1 hypothetical protein [Ignavibacteriales bacterium]
MDKPVIFRFFTSIALAGLALGLFFMSRPKQAKLPERLQHDIGEIVTGVDRDVDSVLARFHIEKSWIRKKQVPVPNSTISRTERQVLIPHDVLPVQMTLAFNTMARRFDGRAIASENMKENSITIHIELEGYIVQTIILKPMVELKKSKEKPRQPRT